jgi:hypothetical protein
VAKETFGGVGKELNDRKLDPNWTEEKSKVLYQRKEEWLTGCTERLNEPQANLRSAEDLDIWSFPGT